MILNTDDYDYDSVSYTPGRDDDAEHETEMDERAAWGWEGYDGELDDNGVTWITRLRRPKWLSQLIDRVILSEIDDWARRLDGEAYSAKYNGKAEVAAALAAFAAQMRDRSRRLAERGGTE